MTLSSIASNPRLQQGLRHARNTLAALLLAQSPLPAATNPPASATPTLDQVCFGHNESEPSHQLTATHSDTIQGGLNEPARRLLPDPAVSWQGGSFSWIMKISPLEQNYLTVKLWGSDKDERSGRLILFANNLQVGYRHEGDHDLLNQTDNDPLAPGRFVYVTVPLPPQQTVGKSTIELRISATGPIWSYGSHFKQYQKDLTLPTRGIYRAYTHTQPRFVPDPAERQGVTPTAPVRPAPGPEVIGKSKEIVRARIARILANPNLPANPKARGEELMLLAAAWHTPWTPAHQNPKALTRIVRLGDAMAAAFTQDRKSIEHEWSGARPLGQAVVLTWPALASHIGGDIPLNGTTTNRRNTWTKLLAHSMNHWRFNRRPFTNQSMIVDAGIYLCNRALQVLDPPSALDEAHALGFLRQSAGIDPWLGSDLPEGGRAAPYGKGYHLITRKGLSRELGYVGSYGETILPFMVELAQLTQDPALRQQTRIVQIARHPFRYPSQDADGYRCMKLASEIDNRVAHYPYSGSAYNAPNVREAWWLETAALLPDDPKILGAAQQAIEEGQYYHLVESRLKSPDTLGMMRNASAWETIHSLPSSPYRLPMTPDQPDHAFADEENAVVAIKHQNTILFANLYFRAERAVNGIARIMEIQPDLTRIAIVRTQTTTIPSGESYTRPDWIDRIRSRGHIPPGQDLHQAWAGEVLPIAKRPTDATAPKYGEWGPFVGKAAFYSFQYGNYLIGLNTTADQTYAVTVPSGIAQAPDLIGGAMVDTRSPVQVPPRSTVVLFLGHAAGN